MKKSLSMIIGLFTIISLAQSKEAKGVVIDESTKKPIPYVNISILKSQAGTSSNEDGSYSLEIKESDFNKDIILTSLGYKDSIIPVKKFINQKNILLKATIEELNEVLISKKFEEKFLVVNQIKKGKIRGLSMVTRNSPYMMALFFPYKNDYSQTKNLNSLIIYLNNKSFFGPKKFPSKFRVRLFSIGKDGLPDNDLISEGVIVETITGQKKVELDISKFNLLFPKDGFYVALEWLYIPFNAYIDTYRTKTEKKHKVLRYAPRFSFSSEKLETYKTALFLSGKWYDSPPNGFKEDEMIVPAISLTLSN